MISERTGRPLPKFSDDEVTDYLVAEAVAVKAAEDEKEAEKRRERAEFRKSHRQLRDTPVAGRPGIMH